MGIDLCAGIRGRGGRRRRRVNTTIQTLTSLRCYYCACAVHGACSTQNHMLRTDIICSIQSTFLPRLLREEPSPALRLEEPLPLFVSPRMYLSTKRMRKSTKYLRSKHAREKTMICHAARFEQDWCATAPVVRMHVGSGLLIGTVEELVGAHTRRPLRRSSRDLTAVLSRAATAPQSRDNKQPNN